MNHKEIPLMFQAKIAGRCQLQRNQADQNHPAYQWKDEWTKLYPKSPFQPLQPPPSTKPNPLARPPKPATVPATRQQTQLAQAPQFGQGVQTRDYSISWRLVCNRGQHSIIRPIILAEFAPLFNQK